MTTPTTETLTVLEGMYAAEAEYLATGGPGKASFEPLAPFFASDVELHQAEALPYGGTWRGHEGTGTPPRSPGSARGQHRSPSAATLSTPRWRTG